MKGYRISLCTTCMNRLVHLKQTLLKNIFDNQDYENLEFVLLDYNSTDGLEDYVKSNLSVFIEQKKLFYYKTKIPENYNMSHSRNLAFKLASGDIVCNIDADNFTGSGFASFVNKVFEDNGDIYLSTHQPILVKKDVLGRICVKKDDFMAVGGYDERMKYYGFDDYDFAGRLEIYGRKKQLINSPEFLKAIPHSDKERMNNWLNIDYLHSLYIRYLSPSQSQLCFLFKNGDVVRGTMVNNLVYNATIANSNTMRSCKYGFSIAEKLWESGKWTIDNGAIKLIINSLEIILQPDKLKGINVLRYQDNIYYKITIKPMIEEAIFFFHQTSNRIIFEENISQRIYKVNESGFGEVADFAFLLSDKQFA